MSAGTQTLTVAPRFERSSSSASGDRHQAARTGIRLGTFAALSLYGIVRWATLLHPAPIARLLGLFLVAATVVWVIPWLRERNPALSIAVAIALGLLVLPLAGLPWLWFVHERIAVSARHIADGLSSLPAATVPYAGASHAVRLVISLGAGVLLLDAAMLMAFAPEALGDARRAGAALPLIALAVVPSTLIRPQLPYLQGLVLFGLLAGFMWGERVRRDAAGAALVVALVVGSGAAIAAPRLDPHRPWIDYRAWAATLVRRHLDTFNWNQTYGPLHWPKSGHQVLTVRARQGDYWKAENLNYFNGYAWVSGPISVEPSLPSPQRSALARWTQPIQVTIQGMQTGDVIAAGQAAEPKGIGGGVGQGTSVGTWTAGRILGPGSAYEVSTYSPSPSPRALSSAGASYPEAQLADYRTLSIPSPQATSGVFPAVTFAPFHAPGRTSLTDGNSIVDPVRMVQSSPYAGAYALARHLAAAAVTPYAFVASVERYLTRGHAYNENPPVRRYPLESFLFTDPIGYCQQFSGAMALLLRMGGIPARVATGFTSGTLDPARHQWTVSDIDAHAWVEAWFPHYGWVRFDPTPSVAPARRDAVPLPILKTLRGQGFAVHAAAQRDAAAAPPAAATRGNSGSDSTLWLIVPALLAALGATLLARAMTGPEASDEELLGELERAMARSGRPLEHGVTLVTLERRFGSSPAAAAYVYALRLARYAGTGSRPTGAQRRALRRQLRFGLGISGRVRALWALPPRVRLGSRRRPGSLKSGS